MVKEELTKRAAEVYPELPAAQAAFIAGMEEASTWITSLEKTINELSARLNNPEMVHVSKENLNQWLAKIKDANQFRAEAETDIGWVAVSIHNIQKMDLSLPKLLKLLSGSVKPESLGLDITRIEEIAAKYAPLTAARLKAENEALPKTK